MHNECMGLYGNLAKIIFIQQKYLFNFNCHIYLILNKTNCSTSIQTFSFNKNHDFFVSKVPGHCKFLHSTKYPVPHHRPIPNMEPIINFKSYIAFYLYSCLFYNLTYT